MHELVCCGSVHGRERESILVGERNEKYKKRETPVCTGGAN